MTKIAINIVLVPSNKMISNLIEINKELLNTNDNKIILGNKINIPHISLCMGGVNKSKIPEVIEKLDEISNDFRQFDFEGKLKVQITSNNEKITWIELLNKKKIQKLHEVVMHKIWNYLNYDIENYMLLNPQEVERSTISWIKDYSNLYYYPLQFEPHITVGIGETENYYETFNFSCSKIAIFQLGNHCTCKKMIYSIDLNRKMN